MGLMSCTSLSAQTLMPDTHRMDSVMQRLEYKYGQKKPWLYKQKQANLQSVVVIRSNKSMGIDPNAGKFTMNTKYYPQSVFSRRDDYMFYKDYGWSNFVTDFLFGM